MKAASIQEIKKELNASDLETVQALCLRLAKYKKENKELLTYLLFEAHDEQTFSENAKEELRDQPPILIYTRNRYAKSFGSPTNK